MKTKHISINAMCSLLVGDPFNPTSQPSLEQRAKARAYFMKMKRLGVEGISLDFWWGLIQPEEGAIDWTKPGAAYYDWIVNLIIECGLKVVPILSFHQCGGNVGDDVYVPIPKWVWEKLARILGDAKFAKFVSEQGNACDEYVSFWATHIILADYLAFVKSFRDHFADRAEHFSEINISLGPAGERRYPSYNGHDKDVDYPTRGALQCYSKLAIESFRAWVLAKYKDLKGVDAAWGTKTAEGQEILPPSNPQQFFNDNDHLDTQYGRDFFDWYSAQPNIHAQMVLKGVFEILAADDSPMKGIDIGVKVPGIHWHTGKWGFDARVTTAVLQGELAEICAAHAKQHEGKDDATAYGDDLATKLADHIRTRTAKWMPAEDGGVLKLGNRLPELAAGLIRTSDSKDWESDEAGRGYRPLIKLFAEFEGNKNSRLVLHFTCLEMADGEGEDRGANSVAQSMVYWVGAEAFRQGVPIKGENAVSWNLPLRDAWERMRMHLLRARLDSASAKPSGAIAERMRQELTADLAAGRLRGSLVGDLADPKSGRVGYFEGLTILRMTHVADDAVATEEMAKTTALAQQINGTYAGEGVEIPEPAVAVAQAVDAQAPAVVTTGGAASSIEQTGPPAAEEKVA